MFDKRLVSLVPGFLPLALASVAGKWLGLLATIGIFWLLAGFAGALVGAGSPPADPAASLAALLALVAVRAAALYGGQRAGDRLALRAKARIRATVSDRLAQLGPSFSETVSSAEAAQTAVEGAQQLEVYFGAYVPQLFYAVLAPLTLFAALVWTAGLPAAVLLACTPLIPVSIMVVMRRAKAVGAAYWDSYVDLGGSFLEAVRGLTTLKVFGADASWHEAMNQEAEGFRRATMRMLVLQLRSIVVMDLVAFGGAALGMVLAVLGLASGQIGFAAAFMVVFLSQEFFLPMRRLGSLFHTAMNGMSAARSLWRLMDAPTPQAGSQALDGACGLRCEGVGYAYGGRTVLSGVDLDVRPGTLTALVGPSGSGKSTLAGILAGRKASYQGTVRLGNVELRQAAPESLARHVVLVGTDAHVFCGTVRSNLLLGRPGATDAELWDALRRARLDGFVRASGGLDTEVRENASNLSGGQRQRLAIARALLADAPVYVFDEATSNIDAESEAAIDALMCELAAQGRTVVAVAHRLASVRDAAQICVLDQGRLVQKGGHPELVAQDGPYARLWRTQEELASWAGQVETPSDDAQPAEKSAPSVGDPAPAACPAEPGDAASLHGPAAEKDAPCAPTAAAPSTAGQPVPRLSAWQVMARLVRLVRPLAGWLALAVLLGVLGSLAAALLPTLGAVGLMDAVHRPVGLALAPALALLVACGLLRGPLRYGEQLLNHYIAFKVLAHVRDVLFSALRRLAPARLEHRRAGDLVSLVTQDVELLEVFFAHTLSPVAIAVVSCLAMLALIGAWAPPLVLPALAGYLVLGVALPLLGHRLCGDAGRRAREAEASASAYVLDGLRGLGESLQYGDCGRRARELAGRTREGARWEDALHRRNALNEAVADAVTWAVSLTVLACALMSAQAGAVAPGRAFVAAFAYLSSFGPVLAVCRLGTSLQPTLASGARVLALLDEEPQTHEVRNGSRLGAGLAGAQVRNVSFSYGPAARDQVLSRASLTVRPGKVTCIVGPSGSGKSTLLKLLMRFWDPASGQVTMNGQDLRSVSTDSLRERQSLLSQDTYLFCGTLRSNLALARPGATEQELHRALEDASLDGLLDRLPKGLDTPVSELGTSLSGGERQRLGLARVFLHDAPLVLLDEPTSNLDALSEAAVMRAVARKAAQKTVVLVSHRASTVGFADVTCTMDQGRMS